MRPSKKAFSVSSSRWPPFACPPSEERISIYRPIRLCIFAVSVLVCGVFAMIFNAFRKGDVQTHPFLHSEWTYLGGRQILVHSPSGEVLQRQIHADLDLFGF